jgi:DNA mismatch repair protein MutS
MGGKSTFMRQTALISIMARLGSYVPATYAQIGNIDRIFTRIGASDDLSSGRSTFMVEMEEASSIINNATSNSLVLMDEIGRGTSTYEGSALALSIAEYMCANVKSFTLFSTHYPEIASLADTYDNIENLCFKAKECEGKIVFMYQANKGSQNYSYAIEVGNLAGLPSGVISKAKSYINTMKKHSSIKEEASENKTVNKQQTNVVEKIVYKEKESEVEDRIKDLDLNSVTPIEALNILNELKGKLL